MPIIRPRAIMSSNRPSTPSNLGTSASKPKLNPRNFPRPPLCERTPRHLRITWRGQTLAETHGGAYWVLETHHPPTYYLPRDSVRVPLQVAQGRSSLCEWKGRATYYDVVDPADEAKVVRQRVWSYHGPTERFRGIDGYVSFYAGPWECWVDGERVEAQPGDFYGGWMTSEIVRESVKGAPGTWGW